MRLYIYYRVKKYKYKILLQIQFYININKIYMSYLIVNYSNLELKVTFI